MISAAQVIHELKSMIIILTNLYNFTKKLSLIISLKEISIISIVVLDSQTIASGYSSEKNTFEKFYKNLRNYPYGMLKTALN